MLVCIVAILYYSCAFSNYFLPFLLHLAPVSLDNSPSQAMCSPHCARTTAQPPTSHSTSSHYTQRNLSYTIEPSTTTTCRTSTPIKKRNVAFAPPPSSYRGSPGEGRTQKARFSPSHNCSSSSVYCWRSDKKLEVPLLRTSERNKTTKNEEEEKMENQGWSPGDCPPPDRSLHSPNQANIKFESDTDPLSNHCSSGRDRYHIPGPGRSQEDAHNSMRVGRNNSELGGAAPSPASLVDARAAQLSLDMKQLMEELKTPLQSLSPGHGGGEEGEGGRRERPAMPPTRSWREGTRGRSASASKTSSMKPKFSSGEWIVTNSIAC